MIRPQINLRLGPVASRTRANYQAVWLGIGLSVLVCLLGGQLLMTQKNNQHLQERILRQKQRLERLSGVETIEEPSTAVRKSVVEQVALANQLIELDAFSWTGLLKKLEETLAPGIRLRQIKPNPQTGTVQLEGVADSPGHLRGYLQKLLAYPAFEHTYLQQQNKVRNEGGSGRDPSLATGRQPVTFRLEIRHAF